MTPLADIMGRLESEIAHVPRDQATSARLASSGLYVRYADAKSFEQILESDKAKIKIVVEASGVTAD